MHSAGQPTGPEDRLEGCMGTGWVVRVVSFFSCSLVEAQRLLELCSEDWLVVEASVPSFLSLAPSACCSFMQGTSSSPFQLEHRHGSIISLC